jgi:hypothetical protein
MCEFRKYVNLRKHMLKFNTVLNGHFAATSQKFIKFGFHCTGSLCKLKALKIQCV